MELTQRVEQVAGLLQDGHNAKEIAQRLGISYYTVKQHLRVLYAALGARDRTEAVLKLYELGEAASGNVAR